MIATPSFPHMITPPPPTHTHLPSHYHPTPSPKVIIIEAVLLIPKPRPLSKLVHSIHNHHKVFEKLRSHVLKHAVLQSNLEGHVQHHHTVERHPGSAVSLLEHTPRGQGAGAVKYSCERTRGESEGEGGSEGRGSEGRGRVRGKGSEERGRGVRGEGGSEGRGNEERRRE